MRRFSAIWDNIALTAATAKTILELPTILNVPIKVDEIFIGMTASAAGNCVMQTGTFTTTGTGTALTPFPIGNDQAASKLTTGKIADTVEPTGFSAGTLGTTLRPAISWPLPGYFAWQAMTEKEMYVIDTPINWAVRLTSSIASNTSGWISWIERA
jgi:hypothetical protein